MSLIVGIGAMLDTLIWFGALNSFDTLPVKLKATQKSHYVPGPPGPLVDKASYHQISQIIEAARLGLMITALWKLTSISAAMLMM